MVNIKIKVDVKQVVKDLNRTQRRQIPFAMKNTLNDLARESRLSLQKGSEKYLDRPTPFTKRGFKYKQATKVKLTSWIYIDEVQSGYLKYQIEGGTRQPPKGNLLPVQAKLNRYGNIVGKKGGLVKSKRRWIGIERGIYGIWERIPKTNKSKLIARIRKRVEYKPRFPFYKIVKELVDKRSIPIFRKRIKQALATAR